ncbi:MAG: ExeA family protein [Gemmataceae bacterium]
MLPTVAEAIAQLPAIPASAAGQGVWLLIGPPGTGKTRAALRWLAAQNPERSAPIYLPAARFLTPRDFYQSILADLGQEYLGRSEHETRLCVQQHWLTESAAGKAAILVLDEAQHTSSEVLEEIRLLDNLRTRHGQLLTVVLVGSTELQNRLQNSPLKARLRATVSLSTLSPAQSVRELRRGMKAAGYDPDDTLNDESAEILATFADGSPRLLHQMARATVALGADDLFDLEAILEVAERFGLRIPGDDSEQSAQSAESSDDLSTESSEANQPEPSPEPKQKARRRKTA